MNEHSRSCKKIHKCEFALSKFAFSQGNCLNTSRELWFPENGTDFKK